ncbi:hypothetical protein Tco_0298516 [Tanacetum coccineum]
MLTPKASSYYNGKCLISFENPDHLKKAQWEKPCLYNVKCDKNDLANRFSPESKETIRLAKNSRSKLGDLVKPCDYTKLNNLYDLFVPQQQKSHEQLYFSNEVKNNIFKTPFQKKPTNFVKNIEYLPKNKSIRKSKYAFQDVQANMDNSKSIVEIDWQQHKINWQNLITQDIKLLIHDMLVPLAHKTLKNVGIFENDLKEEMIEDLKYVKSIEKEVDDLKMEIDDLKSQREHEKTDFPKVDDLLLQEFFSRDYVCVILLSLNVIDEYSDMA